MDVLVTSLFDSGEDKIGRSRLLKFIATCLDNFNYRNGTSNISYYDHAYTSDDSTCLNAARGSPMSDNEAEQNSSLNTYASDCSTAKRPSIQVITYRCQLEQRFNEYGLLRSLLKQLLQFENDEKTQFEREQYLTRLCEINKANDLHLRSNLFLLNDLLHVRFRRSYIETDHANDSNFVQTHDANLNELLLHIVNKLIEPTNPVTETYSSASTGGLVTGTARFVFCPTSGMRA